MIKENVRIMSCKNISDKAEYLSNIIATQITSHMFDGCSYDDCIKIISQAAIASVELLDKAKQMESMK